MEKNIKIGYTGITWHKSKVEEAIATVAASGYWGFETFAWVLEEWEEKGGLGQVLEKHNLPLISAFFMIDCVNRENSQKNIEVVKRGGSLLKKYGGQTAVLCGKILKNRQDYVFTEHRDYIIEQINSTARVLQDMGIVSCFHPHTGTPVETSDEIISVMDSVNTEHVFFAPDIGQIAKGEADPVKIVKDYKSIIKHLHIKDFKGGKVQFDEEGKELDSTGYLCYTPLGEGVVDIKTILSVMEEEGRPINGMVELDGTENAPMPQKEALSISKKYLQGLGYTFKN